MIIISGGRLQYCCEIGGNLTQSASDRLKINSKQIFLLAADDINWVPNLKV